MQMASPIAACPGLPGKPLDATIGQLLALYCPAATRITANNITTKNGPTLMAILMAAAVRRYNTAHIAQWKRSRALIEATGRRHWATIVANSCNQSSLPWFFLSFFHHNLVGKGRGSTLRPLFSIGVWYISKSKRALLRWLCNLLGGLAGRITYGLVVLYCVCILKCIVKNLLYCTFDLNLPPSNWGQFCRVYWWTNQPFLWLHWLIYGVN